MMFLLTCDKKLTKSQLSPTHASTKRKITDELKVAVVTFSRQVSEYGNVQMRLDPKGHPVVVTYRANDSLEKL